MVLFERQRLERLLYSRDLLLIGTWLFSENLTALEGQVVIVLGCAKRVCRALGSKKSTPKKVQKKQGAHVPGSVRGRWGQIALGSPEPAPEAGRCSRRSPSLGAG